MTVNHAPRDVDNFLRLVDNAVTGVDIDVR